MPPADADRRLYQQQITQHILALREALVRHDENLKAWTLLSECVPYFLTDETAAEITQAREDQYAMTRHVLDPDTYALTYARNEHEQPFEVQFGITVDHADRIARVRWLIQELYQHYTTTSFEVIDLGCNDGWMLQHLTERHDPSFHISGVRGVDLNPDCIARAKARFAAARKHRAKNERVVSQFTCDSIENFARNALSSADVVCCFEVLEHVRDPYTILDAARQLTHSGGRIFLSTPNGAVEHGWLPEWDKAEYKGHVRAVTPQEFRVWLEYAATGKPGNKGEGRPVGDWQLTHSPDGLLLGSVRRG